MRISECVHSFYAADSGQPQELRTVLFLDYDPVLPGWTPQEPAEAGPTNPRGAGVTRASEDDRPPSSSRPWGGATD